VLGVARGERVASCHAERGEPEAVDVPPDDLLSRVGRSWITGRPAGFVRAVAADVERLSASQALSAGRDQIAGKRAQPDRAAGLADQGVGTFWSVH
jgi:hypothetical protein